MSKLIIGLLLVFLVQVSSALCPTVTCASTYWVSPTGSATWANAASETPLSGTECASLSSMNAGSKSAGDVIYFRGGTYTISGGNAITVSHSGTNSSSMITYAAYNGETPLFFCNDGPSIDRTGISIVNKNYIRIDGLKIQDFFRWITITGSSYNEVKNCTFYNTEFAPTNMQTMYIGNYGGATHSTHNWIHNNMFYQGGSEPCAEGGDLIRIGSNSTGWDDHHSNFNTIEENIAYWAGHTVTENYGYFNVWRNNFFHNEGWKASGVVYGTATGGSTTSLIDTETDFGSAGVNVNDYIFSLSEYTKRAVVTSISTTSNSNDTLNFSYTSGPFGTPQFSNGIQYAVSHCAYAPSPPDTPQAGKYGHRVMQLTNTDPEEPDHQYNIVEGNRVGFAGTNPANNGADAISLGSPGNIVRYNSFYAGDGAGITLKGYGGSTNFCGKNNAIYNNTVYKNGQAVVGSNNAIIRAAIHFYSVNATGNIFKNNIFYRNGPSPYYVGNTDSYAIDNTWASNFCDSVDSDFSCGAPGDPLFVNSDTLDPTSLTTPNFYLQSSSPAIDQGTYLAKASGSGSNSTTLVADNALYFQDGTWGSALSNIQADWIAIGTVDNTVQVSSINYVTNTITLASAKTWNDDANIWLHKRSDGTQVIYGDAPDQGAYEYSGLSTQGSKMTGISSISGVTMQ